MSPSSSRAIVVATLVTAMFPAVLLAAGPASAGETVEPQASAPAPEPTDEAEGGVTDEPRVTFGIGPASGGTADDRPYITYGVAPGAVIFDSVAIVNQSDEPLELLVYSADGITTEGGGLDVRERASSNISLGSWMTIAEETGPVSVTVPPQSAQTGRGEVVLPVQIAVPQDAPPGDHVGGIVASLVSLSENDEAQNIELEQRVAARFYVRVDGPLEPAVDVEVVDVTYTAGANLWDRGAADVTYRVTNTGNTRLGVQSVLEISGPFGLGAVRAEGEAVSELVPNGGTATFTATLPDVPALIRMTATVDVATAPAPGAEQFDVTDGDSASFWATHWQMLALLVLILVIIIAVVVSIRRRRRRTTRPTPAAAPGDTPTSTVGATAGAG